MLPKYTVFILTFLGYMSLHITRKSYSNLKNNLTDDWNFSESLLASLDMAFMLSYALGLFLTGFLGDRHGAKKILITGLGGTSISFFLLVTVRWWTPISASPSVLQTVLYHVIWCLNGVCQSAGWPNSVKILSNWFDPNRDIMLFGLWAANASVGNIVGNVLIASLQSISSELWVMFLVPSLLVAIVAVCIQCQVAEKKLERKDDDEYLYLTDMEPFVYSVPSFFQILRLPSVLAYAFSYCFLKTVTYTFFFWLSYYLHEEMHLSSALSDNISSFFDMGGIMGGLVIGCLAFKFHYKTTISNCMILLSIFPLLVMCSYASKPYSLDSTMMLDVVIFGAGFLICGPSNIIASAISADVGKNDVPIEGTIIGIIDGMGSVGSGIFQICLPLLINYDGWSFVLTILYCCIILSSLFLISPMISECSHHNRSWSHSFSY